MTETKKEIQAAIASLPDNCTLEDAQYRLYVIQKVRNGLDAVDRGQGIPHDEVVKRLGTWLSK
jgi:predicted transcriptional regulator